MSDADEGWYAAESRTTLRRLMPRLETRFFDRVNTPDWEAFTGRLNAHFPKLFEVLYRLYGIRYDFFYHLEKILITASLAWMERPDDLRGLDAMRASNPQWFQSQRMVGAVCYVDLFAGDLKGLRERIPYLSEMGVTFLHLMPIFRSPEGDDDGGYAISSYRELDPALGTMEELSDLADELRHFGISLCLDFVFNHTADTHEWARKALGGDEEYQAYYRMFPDRRMPDEYERTIRAVFPEEHPGCFTYRSKLRKWVWTTFHNYQWDLNYENPATFDAMAAEMLFLANAGVEILRLDAVAFTWKKLGTGCENLPEAHLIVQAFNALTSIVSPSLLFLSEAIVHPDEVIKYIRPDECQLSYNPQLMALLWSTLATRDVTLLRTAMQRRFRIPNECTWVNYVRCHDDIGWVFSNDDAVDCGIDPDAHRRFLGDFYTGRFTGSFSRGLPFQEDPTTGDMRISGMAASLAGLELALAAGDELEIEASVRRILLLYGVAITIGGIPLIYLGDELAALNDYSFNEDREKLGDTRWVHRPPLDEARLAERHDRATASGQVFHGLMRLLQVRQQNRAFNSADTEFIDTQNPHVFGYFRRHEGQSVLVLANFSEKPQMVAARLLRTLGFRKTVTDILKGAIIVATDELELEPYQMAALLAAD